jgi:hypothetical protein
LLAQAVASIWKMRFRDKPYGALNEEEYARAWLYARQQEAAAVPAGNQAKAPTALDEMRALQEGAQRDGAWHILKQVAGESTADRDLIERLQSQLTESREALARVEAERDECQARNNELIDAFRRADAESRKLRRELKQTETEPRCEGRSIRPSGEYQCLKPESHAGRCLFAHQVRPAGDDAHPRGALNGHSCMRCAGPLRGFDYCEGCHRAEAASEAEVTASPELCCSCGHVASRHMATFGQCYEPECRCQQMRVVFALNPSDPEATESATKEPT